MTERYDGEICDSCTGIVRVHTGSYWNAPDDLWRRVVGKEGGVLCPPCFTAEARAKGIHVSWRAVDETQVARHNAWAQQMWRDFSSGKLTQSVPGRMTFTVLEKRG